MNSIDLKKVTKSQKVNVLGSTFIYDLFINVISGTPAIKIGTTSGGEEILASASYTGFNHIKLEEHFANLTVLYITITGVSTTDIIMDYKRF